MESGEEEKEPKEEQKESGEEEKEPREEDKEPGEEHKESGEGVELLSRRNDEQAEEMGETQATRQHQTESHAGIPHAEVMFPMLLVFSILLSKCRVNMVRVMMRKMVVCKDNDMEEESGSKDDDEAEMYATAEKFEIPEKAKNDVVKVGEKEKESGDVQTETKTKRGEEKLMEKKGGGVAKKPK
ncbi:unnamed protein product, partial [Brassica oleracea]